MRLSSIIFMSQGGTGIRVNVLSPGETATDLAKAALGEEAALRQALVTAGYSEIDIRKIMGQLPASVSRSGGRVAC